jgi:hypothetical protein
VIDVCAPGNFAKLESSIEFEFENQNIVGVINCDAPPNFNQCLVDGMFCLLYVLLLLLFFGVVKT